MYSFSLPQKREWGRGSSQHTPHHCHSNGVACGGLRACLGKQGEAACERLWSMSTPDPSNFVFRSRGSIYHSTSLRAFRLVSPDHVPAREALRQPHDGRDHALDEKVVRPSCPACTRHPTKGEPLREVRPGYCFIGPARRAQSNHQWRTEPASWIRWLFWSPKRAATSWTGSSCSGVNQSSSWEQAPSARARLSISSTPSRRRLP